MSAMDPDPTRQPELFPPTPSNTFIVRISADRARGHVQHVGSRRGLFFSNPKRLQKFIEEHLEADGGADRS
jgi:hypothetical protein